MRVRLFLTAATAAVAFSPGAHAEWLLASSATQVVPGSSLEVSVVRDAEDGKESFPDRLDVVLEAGERRIQVTLVAAAPVAPGGFRRAYRLRWPDTVAGPTVLRLAQRPSSRLVLIAEAAPSLPGQAEATAVPPRDALASMVQEPPALTVNEPMYFLLAVERQAQAHIQLSFKYRLFDADGPVVEWLPYLRRLHFGYTQTAVWDLASESRPFQDTSYRPSVFYLWDFPSAPGAVDGLSLRAGYEHESNGRDGPGSRSIDTLFASADLRRVLGGGSAYVGLTPKLWAYIDKADNPDIQRYRGYGELGLRMGSDDGWLARIRFRRGEAGRGSTQVDLSYPLRRAILADTAAYLHLQIFDGYGPTLLEYNQSRGTQFRIGFSIQR